MYHILDVVTHLVAPVLSFLAEEVSDFYQHPKAQSIHLQDFPVVLDVWHHLAAGLQPERVRAYLPEADATIVSYPVLKQGQWTVLEMLRDAVLKAIEVQREQGVIKHSYEAQVTFALAAGSKEHALLQSFMAELTHRGHNVERFLKDWFVVSRVIMATDPVGLAQSSVPWVFVSAVHAHGVKCPRCWRWEESTHTAALCGRCQAAIK